MTSPVSAEVIAKLRRLRQIHKMSAQELANRMTAAGYPIKRSVIANMEIGVRKEISIDHVVVAAQVLGTTVAALLTETVECPRCGDTPPAGFICGTCGAQGE